LMPAIFDQNVFDCGSISTIKINACLKMRKMPSKMNAFAGV